MSDLIQENSVHCLKGDLQGKKSKEVFQKTKVKERSGVNRKNGLSCKICLNPVTQKTDRIAINEKHEHTFANPHGYVFRIGCFSAAPGGIAYGEETPFFSWFEGYAWQAFLCQKCLALLGWVFCSENHHFFGLILDHLTENSDDSENSEDEAE